MEIIYPDIIIIIKFSTSVSDDNGTSTADPIQAHWICSELINALAIPIDCDVIKEIVNILI